jgi:cytochrome c oxidase assembly protein subunit 15
MSNDDAGAHATPGEARRLARLLRRLALASFVLLLAISTLSAFIRLTREGAGCEPWPECSANAASAGDPGAAASHGASTARVVARLAHRLAASAAFVLIVVMLAAALSTKPPPRREVAICALLLVLALALAVLGRWSSASRVPAVTVGNLLGGLLMVALAWQLASAPRRDGATAGPALLRVAALVAAVAVLVQAALVAVIGWPALPLPLALAHNVASALVLAACLRLALAPPPEAPTLSGR